jgi:RNA-directed DNA polymerase
LEPEWEAHFEPHSYGFRPGRSCHDAIGAIFTALTKRATYVLDADIAKCFDRVNHLALLNKLRTFPTMRRAIKGWLTAGVMDGAELFPTEEGTPQGGVISPLLANIALHGLETAITTAFPLERKLEGTRVRWTPKVIRYADDFVVLHHDRATIETCKQLATEWLHGLGLELKPSKTRIGHTLDEHDGRIGFDFLGFTIRQYRVSLGRSAKDMKGRRLGFKTIITPSQESQRRHQEQIGAVIRAQRMATQANLIGKLNPIIKGWTNYHRAVASKRIFSKMDHLTYLKLRSWAKRRHPQKSGMWVAEHYWHIDSDHHWTFRAKNGLRLHSHADTRIVRHDKVMGARSVYDGDWVYWASRLGRHPDVPGRVAALLRKQKGTCVECGLHFAMEDLVEIDHIVPQGRDGTDEPGNRQLLHAHCHDVKTARAAASSGVPMTRAG